MRYAFGLLIHFSVSGFFLYRVLVLSGKWWLAAPAWAAQAVRALSGIAVLVKSEGAWPSGILGSAPGARSVLYPFTCVTLHMRSKFIFLTWMRHVKIPPLLLGTGSHCISGLIASRAYR
jgi:hypothetical protein